MNPRKACVLRDTLFVVGFIIMLAAYIYEPLIIIGATVMFSGLIPHFRYNRCPHCGKQLGRNEEKYCQHCGEPIDG